MHPDVIVIGGGLMGCTTALWLANAGLSVHLLERSVPGAEASSAAAGILAPCIESHDKPESLNLGLESRAMHRALSARLLEELKLDVGYRPCGALKLAFTDVEYDAIVKLHSELKAAGVESELLGTDDLRARENRINAKAQGALYVPEEAQVDPKALLNAVALAAQSAGVVFRSGATVRKIVIEGSTAKGVQIDDEVLMAENIVVAAGSWTSLIEGLNFKPSTIHPVRGQLISTQTRPPIFNCVVFSERGYVVTRPDGRTLCGSTTERVGFSRGVTLSGLRSIIDTATEIAPCLESATIESYWSSFRPGTPDGLPLVGSAGPQGLFIASGHYRNGILLAPITAQLISQLIAGHEDHPALASLNPTRFSEQAHG